MEIETPQLERETLGELLTKPTQARTIEINADWFTSLPHQEIVMALNELTATTDPKYYEVQEYIRQRNPLSEAAKEDFMIELYSDYSFVGLESKLEILKKRYYERKLHEATLAYSSKPSKQNGHRLKKALDELENSGETQLDGDFTEAIKEIDYELDNVVDDGIKTYSQLDEILAGGIQPARLVVLGARPAVGKSAMMLNLAVQAVEKQEGLAVDIFSLEMTHKQLVHRFLSNLSDINSYRLVAGAKVLNENEKEKIRAKMRYLQSKDIKIFSKQQNVDAIIREIRKRAEGKEKGKYIAMIDYLQLVNVTDTSKQRHLQVGEVTRKLKLLGNELNVPIILLSQLNRGLEGRQDKRPTMSDLRESGDIEQDADIIMFLHPDEDDDGVTNLIVAKNRDGQGGISIPFRFLKSTAFFQEVAR